MRLLTVTLTALVVHSFTGGKVSAISGSAISPISRDSYTREDCMAINGIIVGDIGDGAIFQENYFCESNGAPPVANIVQDTTTTNGTTMIAIEGEVCCGPVIIPSFPTENRWNYTRDECIETGGILVGDVGDGAIFQDTYFCENNGFPPVANIVVATQDTTIAIEGEVCCGPNTTLVTIDDFIWPPMSSDECIMSDGIVTSDPGDGSTFQPGYVCVESDLPPIGTVIIEDITLADEGQVCCPNSTTTDGDDESDNTNNGTTTARAVYTRQECLDANGAIVGDIGDGSIFNEDYVCDSNGLSPLGNVIPNNASEPFAIEGEICCGGPLTEVDLSGGGNMTAAPSEKVDSMNERDFYTRQECLNVNGTIVGDIGDGAIFEVDYICNSTGLPPVADIVQSGTFFALEGEVCCADPSATVVDRMELSRSECEDQGGEVIGDIGNGATQEPGYVCESNGAPPLGNVVSTEGEEPMASEVEVCCGANAVSSDVSSNVASAGVASLVVPRTPFWKSAAVAVGLYSWLLV
jgi:hypothetical protein